MSAASRSYRIYVLMFYACLVSSHLNATTMLFLLTSTSSSVPFLVFPIKVAKPVCSRQYNNKSHIYIRKKRQPLLLAIDEAQYLGTDILNDIKMFMNYGYDSVNYFTLILCGESHLNDTLRKPVHEALRQRITVHYNYAAGLSDEEVSKYILHELNLAGAADSIIDPVPLAATHSFTQGNPRLIDNLMTDALTLGSQQNKQIIDAEIIRARSR